MIRRERVVRVMLSAYVSTDAPKHIHLENLHKYHTAKRVSGSWCWGQGHSLVSKLLCASEYLRFSDVSAVLGHESLQVDFLPIITQHGPQRQESPSKEVRNINSGPHFFSVMVSQQAGIREGPLRRSQIQCV